ncbi:SAM-dependent methyltransferase [Streptomyces smyrnaeus]|uniref:SAM-dependent methyltransferase n=1 Tax=Streptomyces TaxID=1883 RepID=UPI000C186CB4|nr:MULTISPECIES: SAM-dependent methyltransferase [unclassified Streptomyces]MBQ0865423.1 SAM-dependent methyltransferase [Streptomyces sp. RK75]MBQ1121685.1 SAM-dependent methyltransferase [Streptomyces sp. B15]MBQ1162063.1 SAM-dependent methyltransferase [Streptomyces sp. A73]
MTDRIGRAQQLASQIDTTVPHSARIWNYLLGGKDHYAVDREAGDKVCEVFPGMVDITRHSRAFIGRVVRHLAGEAGIRQFLDIGTGLPTVDNTHEIAQRVAPECRIVYVDNDPLVLAHAQALLTSTPEGATSYLHADVRDPARILAEAAETLDFGQPVGLMLMGVLGLVGDHDEARAVTRELLDALPPGSYLGFNDGSTTDPAYVEAIRRFNQRSGAVPYTPRTPEQMAAFFEGLELLEPGIVSIPHWRPEALPFGEPPEVAAYGGVGRKN